MLDAEKSLIDFTFPNTTFFFDMWLPKLLSSSLIAIRSGFSSSICLSAFLINLYSITSFLVSDLFVLKNKLNPSDTGYQWLSFRNFTLPQDNQSLQIFQIVDRTYNNP